MLDRAGASDVLTVSGRLMLKALVARERDPEILADYAKGVMRKEIPALREAPRGRFGDHHALMVGMALEHTEYLEGQIARLDAQIDGLFATHTSQAGVPLAEARRRLCTIPGVGERAAEAIIAEIGVDMSRFPTAGHLASWASEDLGGDYFARRTNPDRRRDHHIEQLQALGYQVTLRKVA